MIIVVSPEAKADIANITRYTRDRWGENQVKTYKESIDKALKLIQEHPQIGRSKDDLFPGCRCFGVGRHVVYYRIKAKRLEIARILHDSADMVHNFVREDGT